MAAESSSAEIHRGNRTVSGDREQILGRVNRALAPIANRAPLPDWEGEMAVARSIVARRDPVELLLERIHLVNGRGFTDASVVAAELRAGGWTTGYCDPALWPDLQPHFDGFNIRTEYDRAEIDALSFGITRAVGAIAETGTVVLNDATTTRRLAALAPWVHVAVVERSTIHPTLLDAVKHLGSDPNVIWVTGPSKTADVEGILIEGVHGPGMQFALVTGC